MRLALAITGSLAQHLRAEAEAGAVATSRVMASVAERAKQDLRSQTVGAGLGQRLARAWRSASYPAGGEPSLSAAAVVWSKAPKLHAAFAESVTIRSAEGFFLAIPTDAARGRYRNRAISPSNWPDHRFGKLRFVYRRQGPSLLVADGQRQRAGKRGGFGKAGKRATVKGETATVIMFVLVPQVRLRKRLDLETVERRWADAIPGMILRAWDAEVARTAGQGARRSIGR